MNQVVQYVELIGLVCFLICYSATEVDGRQGASSSDSRLSFHALDDLPDEIGVAGPIVGVIGDSLVVAGGANFARPDDPDLWELPKLYHKQSWILNRQNALGKTNYFWQEKSGLELAESVAYSSVVSTRLGILCMGGENENGPTSRAFLLDLKTGADDEPPRLVENDLGVPDLPVRCTAGGAAIVGDFVYLVAGQVAEIDNKLAASRSVFRIQLSTLEKLLDSDVNQQSKFWEPVVSWPREGPRRMFPQVTAQHDGFVDRLFVIGGRRFLDGSEKSDLKNLQAMQDVWSFNPEDYDPDRYDGETYLASSPWKRHADAPVPLTAGTAVPYGPAHIVVPGAATLSILHDSIDKGIEMKDYDHPGFPRQIYAYHTITDTWIELGENKGTQVTTPAVKWGDDIVVVSGEIRPRVRTKQVWRIKVNEIAHSFGAINMVVVVAYLLAMVGIGVVFTFRNKTTDDYFRGGKEVPWWAAGCSIFATMLSSITYMAIPAKAFAQDWVYWIGSFLILAIAPIAIHIALPLLSANRRNERL